MTKSLLQTHFGCLIEKQRIDLVDIEIYISPNCLFSIRTFRGR